MRDDFTYREDFQLYWPTFDAKPEDCFKTVKRGLGWMDEAIKITKDRSICVQAGGHVGLWPLRLAGYFDTVFTFEPEKTLFQCMKLNVIKAGIENIVMSDTALGAQHGTAKLKHHPSAGSSHIDPAGERDVSMVTIDGMELNSCGAIFLDVERYEIQALQGAAKTIRKFRPVLHVEILKGERDKMDSFMDDIGYKHHKSVGRDVVYVSA